jgi:hypothetical protein
MEFKTFDDIDDMLAVMTEAQTRADEAANDYQKTAKIGDCYVRFEPALGIMIYGELLDPIEGEREAGADEDEIEYARQMYSQPHMENYRFGRHYSEMCPNGELGDVHVCSIMQVVSREQFNLAKALGWPSDREEVQALLNVQPPQEG